MRVRDVECAKLREILAKGRSAVGLAPGAKVGSKEGSEDRSKKMSQEGSKDQSQERSKDRSKDQSQEGVKKGSQNESKEGSKEGVKEGQKEGSQEGSRTDPLATTQAEAVGRSKTVREADEMLAQFLETIKSMLSVVPGTRDYARGYSMPSYQQ